MITTCYHFTKLKPYECYYFVILGNLYILIIVNLCLRLVKYILIKSVNRIKIEFNQIEIKIKDFNKSVDDYVVCYRFH